LKVVHAEAFWKGFVFRQHSPTAARRSADSRYALRRLEEFPESGRLIEFPGLPHREVIVPRFFYRIGKSEVPDVATELRLGPKRARALIDRVDENRSFLTLPNRRSILAGASGRPARAERHGRDRLQRRKIRFLGSSMVEHAAVNRRVVGSSPTRGANPLRPRNRSARSLQRPSAVMARGSSCNWRCDGRRLRARLSGDPVAHRKQRDFERDAQGVETAAELSLTLRIEL
jgi:hypothetical protein